MHLTCCDIFKFSYKCFIILLSLKNLLLKCDFLQICEIAGWCLFFISNFFTSYSENMVFMILFFRKNQFLQYSKMLEKYGSLPLIRFTFVCNSIRTVLLSRFLQIHVLNILACWSYWLRKVFLKISYKIPSCDHFIYCASI